MRSAPLFGLVLTVLALGAAAASAGPVLPELTGRVVDQVELLRPETKASLERTLEAHERETTNQVVVAIVASLEGDVIENYAFRLARDWALGQRDRDNGVLLLVAPNERQVRIEVGYGLEGALTDALTSMIVQERVLPAFRAGDYEAGIRSGVEAVLAVIKGEFRQQDDAGREGLWIIIAFVGLFGLGQFLMIREVLRLSRAGVGSLKSGSHRDRWSSSSGSSAGSFSGGGGSFGGGGATGRW